MKRDLIFPTLLILLLRLLYYKYHYSTVGQRSQKCSRAAARHRIQHYLVSYCVHVQQGFLSSADKIDWHLAHMGISYLLLVYLFCSCAE